MECLQVVFARKRVFDPQSPFLQRSNKIFLVLCAVSLVLDPLFFYVFGIDSPRKCFKLDTKLETVAIALRFSTDILYIFRVIFRFRTGFYDHRHTAAEHSDFHADSSLIARRYVRSYFLIDILATLPLPQVAILFIIPTMGGSKFSNTIDLLKFIVVFQFIPKFFRFYKLLREVMHSSYGSSGIARSRIAMAFLFCMWAGHVLGGFWYLLAIEREMVCWKNACRGHAGCNQNALYCDGHLGDERSRDVHTFFNTSCPTDVEGRSPFDFGMFIDAHNSGIMESRNFWQKFVYCFWWALQNLSTLGQNLKTSTMGWEICFAVVIFICGLVLFSFVIGIIQKQETMLSMLSSKITTEKTKMKLLQDVEHWMETRLLPDDLKERVRQYQQLKWERNQVLDVDNLLNNLPSNLRKDVIHHLCMTSIRKVPMFEQMDEQLVDALCERLNQAVYTEKIYIIREGDPVHEMLFVVRGNLLTTSSDNGRPGFFNYQYLMAGDFCGEELQMWILDPNSSSNLPISLRTVRTLTEVEAFSLKVDDFKFITSRLLPHSQQYRQNFRFYSQQWRTWAACFIQAAWRYRKRKLEKAIREEENKLQNALANSSGGAPSLGAAIYASRFAANALRAIRRTGYRQVRLVENVPLMLVRKPAEPDFTDEERLL